MTIPLSPSCTSFIISMKRDCIACKDHHITPSALQKTREMHSWEGCAAAMRAWFKCSNSFIITRPLQIANLCKFARLKTRVAKGDSRTHLEGTLDRCGICGMSVQDPEFGWIWMKLAHIPESLTALSLQCSLHSFRPQQNQLIPFVSYLDSA